ncbi:hypothetical protein SBA4_5440024 [Candidatus Sulfopaludibacter sp. SbA4]|nr:hypothetical protein SBA4_5440024 [Candidatus Sulfopaludibacter sp. SbA4]
MRISGCVELCEDESDFSAPDHRRSMVRRIADGELPDAGAFLDRRHLPGVARRIASGFPRACRDGLPGAGFAGFEVAGLDRAKIRPSRAIPNKGGTFYEKVLLRLYYVPGRDQTEVHLLGILMNPPRLVEGVHRFTEFNFTTGMVRLQTRA